MSDADANTPGTVPLSPLLESKPLWKCEVTGCDFASAIEYEATAHLATTGHSLRNAHGLQLTMPPLAPSPSSATSPTGAAAVDLPAAAKDAADRFNARQGLAPLRQRLTFTERQQEIIRAQCCTSVDKPEETATDAEFAAFIATCERLQLDPLARQIHFMKRGAQGKKVGRAEVGIDGYRVLAERTGLYEGQTPAEWCHLEMARGQVTLTWYDVWPFPKGTNPLAARVGVYRKGLREPMLAVARFDAYRQNKYGGELNEMWSKMGPEQLAKCAEALALRKAFPNQLGGIYTSEEMGQLDEPEQPQRQQRQARSARSDTGRQQQGRTTTTRQQQPTDEVTHPLGIKVGETVTAEPGVPLPALYPVKGPLYRVPLNAKVDGEYVIDAQALQDAEQKVSDVLQARREKKRPAADLEPLERTLGELADELSRRADEEEAAALGGGSYT